MWLIARGAMADIDGGKAPHRDASLLSRARVQHRGGPPDPGEHLMSGTINVALAGAGAFGVKHLDAIKLIDGVKVISVIGRELDKTKEVADKYGISHVTTELETSLAAEGRRCGDPLHADADACRAGARLPEGRQTRAGGDPARATALKDGRGRGRAAAAHRAGRDVRAHAPLQSEPPVGAQADQGGRTRQSSRWTCRRISSAAPTSTRSASRGSWTDHLLWHHAAHTVDLFAYQTGGTIVAANALQGPDPPGARHRDGHVASS